MKLVEVFKSLGDDNRIRIVNLLLKQELCVCEIETLLDITQSNASRHLTKLKSSGIITSVKKSQWVKYLICPSFILNQKALYDYIIVEMAKYTQLVEDDRKLALYKVGPYSCENIREDQNKVKEYLEG